MTLGEFPWNMGLMNSSTWDLLINAAALFFWFRLWMPEERDLYFNPYVASLWRFSEQAIGALRAVFLRTPGQLIALICFLFLLVFRGVSFYGLAMRHQTSAWVLHLGFEGIPLHAGNAGVVAFVAFSFMSFAVFLFTFWGLALLYAGRKTSPFNHASGALFHVSRPFSLVPLELRPPVLLGVGILLGLLFNVDPSRGSEAFSAVPLTATAFLKYFLSALQGWVAVLSVLQLLMLLLIIGSWAAMFSTSHELMLFCKDWIELLLGPLRRFPLHLGPLDLTPILFFFALKYLQAFLSAMLTKSYLGLP